MIHIIQNDPQVPPGLVTSELDRLNEEWKLIHPYRSEQFPDPLTIKALIVIGGAMGANDDAKYPFLTGLKSLIRDVVAFDIPYLGICLGGQLLAAALGAEVTSGRYGEKGINSVSLTDEGIADHLFADIRPEFATFQWHYDSFDIPENGIRLAFSAICPNQAFRVGTCAWGTQFHPEVDENIIRDWCSWSSKTAARVEDFVNAYRRQSLEYAQTAQTIIANFIRIADITPRRVHR